VPTSPVCFSISADFIDKIAQQYQMPEQQDVKEDHVRSTRVSMGMSLHPTERLVSRKDQSSLLRQLPLSLSWFWKNRPHRIESGVTWNRSFSGQL
jgi:hypothetical protein